MVILGQALLDEIEKAENDGEDIMAWQFGALDALTKQLSGAITAVVTMLKQLGLSQRDFVVFRERVHQQLEPAVLALLNAELGKDRGPGDGSPGRRVRSGAGTPEAESRICPCSVVLRASLAARGGTRCDD